jgi:predicted Co/Zn/Cd cation transporter (cation efflux family)
VPVGFCRRIGVVSAVVVHRRGVEVGADGAASRIMAHNCSSMVFVGAISEERGMDTTPEQRVLKQSIVATGLVAVSCVGFGLWAASQSIVFDGVYSLLDVLLTLGSLAVSKLVSRAGSRRFQFGYWHLEPLVLVFNSAMLSLACAYALINGIEGLRGPGRAMPFEAGIVWVLAIGAVSMGFWIYVSRHARRLDSELLRLDAKGWLVSGALNSALLLAFVLGALARQTRYASAGEYADSLALAVLALLMLPVPLRSLMRALSEVMQIAPADLDRRVRKVLDAVNAHHALAGYRSFVAKTGRIAMVEVHFKVPAEMPIGSIGKLDAIRTEIAAELDEPHVWLTVNFSGRDLFPHRASNSGAS